MSGPGTSGPGDDPGRSRAALRQARSALERELDGDRAAAGRFVQAYRDHLDRRVDALRAALDGGDDHTAHVVALTLHCTSAMVGAHGLAEVSAQVRDRVRQDGVVSARLLLPALEDAARAAARDLDAEER